MFEKRNLKKIFIVPLLAIAAIFCALFFGCNKPEPEALNYDVPFGAEYCVSDLFPVEEVPKSDGLHLVYAEGNEFSTRAEGGKVYITANSVGTGVFSLYSGETYLRKVNLTCVKKSFYLKDDQKKAEAALKNLKLGTRTEIPFNVFPAYYNDLEIEVDPEYFELAEGNVLIPVGVGASEIKVKAAYSDNVITFETSATFTSAKSEHGDLSVESLARNALNITDGKPVTATKLGEITALHRFSLGQLENIVWCNGEDLYPMTALETYYVDARNNKTELNFNPSRYTKLKTLIIKAATLGETQISSLPDLSVITMANVTLTGSLTVDGCKSLKTLTASLDSAEGVQGKISIFGVHPQALSVDVPYGFDLYSSLSLKAGEEGQTCSFNAVMHGGSITLENVAFAKDSQVSVTGTVNQGLYDTVAADYEGLWTATFDTLTVRNMTLDGYTLNARELYLDKVVSAVNAFELKGAVGYLEVSETCKLGSLKAKGDILTGVYFPTTINLEWLDLSGCTSLTELSFGGHADIVNVDVSETKLQGLEFTNSLYGFKYVAAENARKIIANDNSKTLIDWLRESNVTVYMGEDESNIEWGTYTYDSIEEAVEDLPTVKAIKKIKINMNKANAQGLAVTVPAVVEKLTLKVADNLYCKDLRFVFVDSEVPVEFAIESTGCVLSNDTFTQGGVIDALRPMKLNIAGEVTFYGHAAANGVNGSNSNSTVNTSNSNAKAGGAGGDGKNALSSAINAEKLDITVSSLGTKAGKFAVFGGKGGNGGHGGIGQDSNGPGHAKSGNGGNGGEGGDGTSAIYCKGDMTITVESGSSAYFFGGNGGNGGNGGKGGDGINENQRDHGGAGGYGGKGGNAAPAIIYRTTLTVVNNGNELRIVGGTGGNGGNGGKGGAAYSGSFWEGGNAKKGKGGSAGSGGAASKYANYTVEPVVTGKVSLEYGKAGASGSAGADGDGNGDNA